jgi:hypothetical protein
VILVILTLPGFAESGSIFAHRRVIFSSRLGSPDLARNQRKQNVMAVRSSSRGILSPDRADEREQIMQALTQAYWMEVETVMSEAEGRA